jgi:hypothetical protein
MEGAPVDVCRYRTNAKRVLIAAAQPARPVARAHSRVAGDAAGRRRNLSSSPPETCARRTPHDALGRTERVYVAIGAKVLQHGVVKFLHRLELTGVAPRSFLQGNDAITALVFTPAGQMSVACGLTMIRPHLAVYVLPVPRRTDQRLHGANCAESFGI